MPESKEVKQRDIDLQFFPEGGTFVEGVKNKVAFKAVNDFGKGIDFTGEIIDDPGNKNVSKLEIEKSDLPGGIVKFTLFNSDNVPVCERLVFNNYVNVVGLKIQTGKTSYLPCDSVMVEIQAISADGVANRAICPCRFIILIIN